MRCKLPALTKKRAQWLLNHCYDVFLEREQSPALTESGFDSEDQRLLLVVRSMQEFNMKHRTDEVIALADWFDDPGFLEWNSEGTTMWLAMALAIRELYDSTRSELRAKLM